jgi:hypothetical protein
MLANVAPSSRQTPEEKIHDHAHVEKCATTGPGLSVTVDVHRIGLRVSARPSERLPLFPGISGFPHGPFHGHLDR